MKKILTVFAVALMALTMISASAEAGRKAKNTAYILGGVLGGLFLADVLTNRSHAAPAPAYVPAPPPARLVQRCWDEPRSKWSAYHGGYVTFYVQRCEWVQY